MLKITINFLLKYIYEFQKDTNICIQGKKIQIQTKDTV